MPSNVIRNIVTAALVMLVVRGGGGAAPQDQTVTKVSFVVRDQPSRPATLYADGRPITTHWQRIWRPMCGTPPQSITRQDLLQINQAHDAEMQAMPSGSDGETDDLGSPDGAGITIVYNLGPSVPGAAVAAFNAAKAYIEDRSAPLTGQGRRFCSAPRPAGRSRTVAHRPASQAGTPAHRDQCQSQHERNEQDPG